MTDKRNLLKYKENYTEDILDVGIDIDAYVDNNNIYLGLSYMDDGYLEPYGDITVNLGDNLMPYFAYLDTNNLPGIDKFVEENGIGSFTGIMKRSGFCEFPLFELDAERLRGLCPEGAGIYEALALKQDLDQRIDEIREKEEEGDFKVVLVSPGERPKTVSIDGSLKSMQSLVGGYIEPVGGFLSHSDDIILVNEEGKLSGLEMNRGLFDKAGNMRDVICGNFFICSSDGENFKGLSDEKAAEYMEQFRDPERFFYDNDGCLCSEIIPTPEIEPDR